LLELHSHLPHAGMKGSLLSLPPLLAWLVVGSYLQAATGGHRGVCRKLSLETAPSQTFHAAWNFDGRELVVVDLSGGRLLRYGSDGHFLGSVMRPGEGDRELSKPTQIHATRDGWVIQDVGRKWVWVDRQFNFLRALSTLGPDGRPIVQLVDESLSGDELAGFGSYRKPDRTWSIALLRAGLKPLTMRQMVEEISIETRDGTLYGTVGPVVAHLGGQAYFLRFAEPSYILRANPKSRLKAFPPGFDRLPALPKSQGPQSSAPRQQALQKSALPVGLYASEPFLYLLTRRPELKGTTWQLHRIDPRKDRLVGSLTLPTTANDLVLAPGPSDWAVLEKGPIRPDGDQPVTRLLLIPRSWIADSGTAAELTCP
jgi:hypothetical protein